jgi:hypothetical protein
VELHRHLDGVAVAVAEHDEGPDLYARELIHAEAVERARG